jgi:hypothetical protein
MSSSTRRIDRGRGHSYLLDGDKVPGVTTLIGDGMPKPALIRWAAKGVAEYCYRERDGKLADCDELEYVRIAKGAPWDDRDRAARRGTEVHAIAEQLAGDVEVDVPDELTSHVDQYLAFVHDFEPDYVATERAVFSRKHRYAGTFDAIAHVPALGPGNTLLDLKTSRSGPFGEVALQLAAYRHADIYIDGDGNESDMTTLDIRRCAVLWVTHDTYELRPVETGADVLRTFLYVQQVALRRPELDELIGLPVVPDAVVHA